MSDQAKHICGEFLPYMRNKYKIRESDIFIDPACKALRLEIEKFGLSTTGADNNGHDVKGSAKGIMCGIEMLQTGLQEGRVYFVDDPLYGVEPIIKEIGLYCMGTNGLPVDAYNHSLDELRYGHNYFAKTYGLWGN